jgi:hypothetical protein
MWRGLIYGDYYAACLWEGRKNRDVEEQKILKHSTKLKCEINPLNAELNPICNLLALGAHHILHVGRIRVNVVAVVKG